MNHIPCHTVAGSVSMKETGMKTIKQDKQKAQCVACFVGNSLNIVVFSSSTKRSV